MNNVKKWFFRNIIWIVILIVGIIGIGYVEAMYLEEIKAFDNAVYEYVVNNLRFEWLTPFIIFITDLGSPIVLLGACALAIIFATNKKKGLLVSINLIGISVLNVLLKNIVQRGRPEGFELIEQGGYSFPSGHSMVSTAFYGLLIYFVYNRIEKKWLKNLLCVIVFVMLILIGFSRIYLGVHYFSDVVAGFFISIIYLILIINTVSKLTKMEKKRIRETKKVVNSFKYAISGIVLALKEERNMKIHLSAIIVVTILGVILQISSIEVMILALVIGLVISAELFNTAIEVLTDVVMPEKNEKAKITKDIAAGAVLVTSIIAVFIGIIIFVPKIFI